MRKKVYIVQPISWILLSVVGAILLWQGFRWFFSWLAQPHELDGD